MSAIQSEARATLLAKLASGEFSFEEVRACPCGEPATIPIADQDRFGIPVGVVMCPGCGLVRTTPRLAAADLPAFYEHDYHGLHLSIREPDPNAALYEQGSGGAIYQTVRTLLPPGRLRIADVGCGTGRMLREFQTAAAAHETAAAGCDFAAAFVAAGKVAGSDLRHGGPETLLDLAPFDLVILSHVVEHLPDPVDDLAAIRALGHADSLYYVEVPGMMTIGRKPEYAYRLEQYLTLAHTYHYTLTTLTATLARAGLALVEGTEDVRSVFRWSSPSTPTSDPTMAPRILDSLRSLRSFRTRVRRVKPLLRQRAGQAARTLLPGGIYRVLRKYGA